ncbi:glucosaminidase domain-containing protein [Odoribacter sp. Z80]|mgnify:FL=1|uniref:glucosaminidase domain-containing protein n=1 Tax=Odoribacter sp. Z80 TaxID=2304575 RepID=UPI001F00D9C9|nr:glucosaminidase domain-containing protein [Odoribacter sp. Z80]
MKNSKFIFYTLPLGILLLLTLNTLAETRKEFIRKYKHIAIREMERTGIPASITLAQGILESGCGKSELAVNANNHFGIKCHNGWEGGTYFMDDDEKGECFRKYKNPEQSWIDHSEFLTSRPRYAGLFNLPATDYKAWAKGLKAAGYATNPRYAEMLIKIIEEEELYKYDHTVKHTGGGTPSISVEEFAESIASQNRPGNISYRNREEMRNGIICIEAIAGDSFEKIARYYGIKLKKILAYNDKKDTSLKTGQLVFLKKKKNKAARGYEFHRVKRGDNLYDISQQYGVRLKNIINYNYLTADTPLTEGEKIFLRKKADIL